MGRKLSKRTAFVLKMLDDGKDSGAIYEAAEKKKIKVTSGDIYRAKVRLGSMKVGVGPLHIRAKVETDTVKKTLMQAWDVALAEFPDLKKVELEISGGEVIVKLGETKVEWRPL